MTSNRPMSSLVLGAMELTGRGLSQDQAEAFVAAVGRMDNHLTPGQAWQWITRNLLRPEHPMDVHEYLHGLVFADWNPADGPPPAWFPEDPDSSNIAWLMRSAGKQTYRDLHAWSISHREEFWTTMIERLGVRFREPFGRGSDLSARLRVSAVARGGGETETSFNSCFQSPDDSWPVIYQAEDGPLEHLSVADLRSMAYRVANGLAELGIETNHPVAIDMPMTVESVAIYLGACGGRLSGGHRGRQALLPQRLRSAWSLARSAASSPRILPFVSARGCRFTKKCGPPTRRGDRPAVPPVPRLRTAGGRHCLAGLPLERPNFRPVPRNQRHQHDLVRPARAGRPRPFPGTRLRRSKAAIDAHLHHDVHAGDALRWPSNMGWMMGPWLVYAALMNKAAIALFSGGRAPESSPSSSKTPE